MFCKSEPVSTLAASLLAPGYVLQLHVRTCNLELLGVCIKTRLAVFAALELRMSGKPLEELLVRCHCILDSLFADIVAYGVQPFVTRLILELSEHLAQFIV